MFKHILVPTDGSQNAQEAACAAIAFAHEEGARVTAYFALNVDNLRPRPRAPVDNISEIDWDRVYAERIEKQAGDALKFVATTAKKAGVPCETRLDFTRRRPYQAIVHEAEMDGCDLIYMAADSHKTWKDWFTPAQATKVMTHTTVPVLIYQH
jgi:nucleotide-binding universal stress UspA family protein